MFFEDLKERASLKRDANQSTVQKINFQFGWKKPASGGG